MAARPRCRKYPACPARLSPGDVRLGNTACLTCRTIARLAAGSKHKHKRSVTEDEQRRHTVAVRNGRRTR